MMSLTRRHALVGLAAAASLPLLGRHAAAQAPEGPFKLPPLPYANDALEPHIDARTMEIHHDRHHAAYVNNMNGFAKDH
ncbi:MAG: superoxide dismutase, partial [Rhizobiales bacterium]|nr:superoxide dismutase [Hyphomicrobiales bacterium]